MEITTLTFHNEMDGMDSGVRDDQYTSLALVLLSE
jgi:hypothetical protein